MRLRCSLAAHIVANDKAGSSSLPNRTNFMNQKIEKGVIVNDTSYFKKLIGCKGRVVEVKDESVFCSVLFEGEVLARKMYITSVDFYEKIFYQIL